MQNTPLLPDPQALFAAAVEISKELSGWYEACSLYTRMHPKEPMIVQGQTLKDCGQVH